MRIVAYFIPLPKHQGVSGLNPTLLEHDDGVYGKDMDLSHWCRYTLQQAKYIITHVGKRHINAQRRAGQPQFGCLIVGSVTSLVTTVQNW